MKRLISLVLITVLFILQVPFVTALDEIYVEGGFSSRLLARSENLSFNLSISNSLNSSLKAVLIFGKYAGGKLQDTDIYFYDNIPAGASAISEETAVFDEKTDKITAFLFDSLNSAKPIFVGDAVMDEYEPLISNYMNSSLVTAVSHDIPTGDSFTSRFPNCVEFSYNPDRATVSGGGMLAEFKEGGPKEVYIKTISKANDTNQLFKQFRSVRIIDPDGKTVCFYDFSEKDLETEEIILSVPEGKAGIWTISYIGGRPNGDRITIGVPECIAWGIRGETSFKFITNTPRQWYVYVPAKSTDVCKIKKNGYTAAIKIYDENGDLIPENTDENSYYSYEITPKATDVVWKVTNTRKLGDEIASEVLCFATGVPGLLCPTEEMARRLKGGTVFSDDGILLGGNYQKIVRNAMLSHKDDDLAVNLDFLSEIPEEIDENKLDIEAILFGVYGGLYGIAKGVEKQVLDPTSPYFGAFPSAENDLTKTYESFVYGGRHTMGQSASLAAVAAIPTKLNPGYNNRALITRSMLAAFTHFMAMSPDFLIRENVNSRGNFWPMQHVFFIYPNIAEAYLLLKDKITKEEAEIWRNGLILIGDKLCNYFASESNQWSEIIYGHLMVYQATGEERFLKYFERAAEGFTKENKQFDGSNGQHSSGYYMEKYAPSGSYQDLSMHNYVAAYLDYKNLADRNEEICKTMRESIERAVTYESLFWLKQPSGSVISPTAVNYRAPIEMMANCGYPGTFLAAIDFPAARGLIQMLPYSATNYKYATTMPHVTLNNPSFARKIVETGLKAKGEYSNGNVSGSWTPRVYRAYANVKRTETASTPPIYETDKFWDLEGTVGIKKNGWYVLSVYNARATGGSARSGLPTAIWHEDVGAVLTAMNYTLEDATLSTHSRIEVLSGEALYKTAYENGEFSWVKEGESFKISQNVSSVGKAEILTEMKANGVKLSVALQSINENTIDNAYVILPINISQGTANLENGDLTYTVGEKTVHILAEGCEWNSDVISTKAGNVKELKIPVYNGSATIEFIK
ncbi:MAG: hypothetical protein J6L59_04960 [Clostridia bacterium]|nr:hypothetical protein [Clostridia bacterium]